MVWPTELDFFGFITFTNPSSSRPKSYISHIIIDIFLYLWFSLVGMIISQLEHVYISPEAFKVQTFKVASHEFKDEFEF